MPKLHITDWQPRLQGLQNVPAIKLLVENTSYGLKEAKDCVDVVLKGGQVTVPMKNLAKAETLAAKLREMGAVVTVES